MRVAIVHPLLRTAAAAVVVVICFRAGTACAAPANYPYLSWQDEFDGTGVETARWAFDLGTGSQFGLTGWGNNELQYYTDRTQNATVSGGMLQITARSESYGGQSYTSARLKTLGKFSQAGGRFVMRAALPTGQGLWPAFWMLPANDAYGGWAASGEIDIMEAKGQQPDRVAGTIHYGGSWPDNTQSSATRIFPSGQTIASFHTYAVEWDTTSSPALRWYVDDVLYASRSSWWTSGGAYPAPFDQPFYLLLNLAVGGNYVGSPNGSTPFPATMQVDYVRAYTAAPPAITLAATSGTLTQAAVGNPVIAAAASVTKTGAGTMRLTAANAYAGPTRIQAGRLELDALASIAASTAVQIDPGATFDVAALTSGYHVPATQTLVGSGTVRGSVVFGRGSTLAPGAIGSAGALANAALEPAASESIATVPEPPAGAMAALACVAGWLMNAVRSSFKTRRRSRIAA
jgi:autotransporter-associated beta strand protein